MSWFSIKCLFVIGGWLRSLVELPIRDDGEKYLRTKSESQFNFTFEFCVGADELLNWSICLFFF